MHAWIDSKREEIVQTIKELISMESVMAEPSEGAPFGTENKRALEYALKKASELGIENCVDLSGYVGYAETGNGDEMLGILCHLDVVSAGNGWKTSPFEATVIDGNLYGRGAMDDKGPAVAAMYALAAVLKSKKEFKRRVRIIFGCNEESGWGCMKHYKENAEIPTLAFSPDAEYPVVNSEKGILHTTYEKKFDSKIEVQAGTVINVVPGTASAIVPLEKSEVEKKAKCPLPFEIKATDKGSEIIVTGLAAHASLPENGKNAVQAMLKLLNSLELGGEDGETIKMLCDKLGMDMHGESMGLDYSDASGRLTFNPAVLKWDKDGINALSFDLRCPHTKSCDENLNLLTSELCGFTAVSSSEQPALFVDPNSELVSKLLEVYSKNTGEKDPKPKSIGGGTYARAFKNAVAFGCEREGVDNRIHMPDEFISIDDLMFNVHMIADAIDALS
ncbi:MAG: Sapep family Mn(2+)-dependent dipeptidase [Clostridia bacterium]|nr:Sapep family Mn(2+)-dependent dipeptidase [Clostridia bacterium]